MARSNKNSVDLPVTFVGLNKGEEAPCFAAYQLDSARRPIKKLGVYDGQTLNINFGNTQSIALGPDVADFKTLPKESLANYRVAQIIDLGKKGGILLPSDIWSRFHFHLSCVTGTVRKCRPWFWDLLDNIQLTPMFELAQVARIKPITAELQPHLSFPFNCQTVCDGIVEIYERKCCCTHIHIPDLLARLRDVLDVLPIPLPELIPIPIPGPDPSPFTPQLLRQKARVIQGRKRPLDLSAVPPENLHQDYLALRTMSADTARLYVIERPYLFPFFCSCSVRKVGETAIKPDGEFDFCYLQVHHRPHRGHCVTTYAYKVKQVINGVSTLVYDGLAANQYFANGDPADIRTYNPQARICADGPGDPPPSAGQDFVMLEHVGSNGSYHFNFPEQTGVSQVGALGLDDGTYTTSYAPDCPWGGGLGLRLWFSPALEPIVKYYRLKVFAVNDAGSPVGTATILNNSLSWDKLIDVPGDIVVAPEILGPMSVGAENDLFKVPYWSSPDHRYLSGQFHQAWNTTQAMFPDGKYLLVLEVFNAAGNQIKPNGSAGPGTAQNFQFRRWASAVDTDPVPFADMAHVFWVDNTPVGGDIVDLRKDGVINVDECQFTTGTTDSAFAIGFRAFHINGVEHAGNGDHNSFMFRYNIVWQRGLNGSTGTLGPAPSGGNNHTDVGETGDAVSSGTETFGNMLGTEVTKCPFSVTLRVHAKHFTGASRIQGYDYFETASFALEITD